MEAAINGTSIYYEDHGSGPPVIFHHGYTSSRDVWEDVVPRLQDRYRCIAMDCRGAGDSGRPEGGYNLAQYAADIIALADSLALDTFTYVGLSMGGATGFELALRYPERLEKMVLVAPAPADGIQAPPSALAASLKQWEERPREEMIQQRILSGGRPNPEYLARAVDRTLSVSRGHFVDSWESMCALRLGDRLGEIVTPTLIVAAAADSLLPSNLKDYARLGNATLHVFSRVGHGIPYEVPAALSRVLADFFEHGVVNARTIQARLRETASAR